MSDQGESPVPIPSDWLEEFEAAARRPLPLRFRYAFIKTYKPVLDDAPFRAFDTMDDCRRWCEESLPGDVRYLFIGKSGAILLEFPDTTQDAVLFVEKEPANTRALVEALGDSVGGPQCGGVCALCGVGALEHPRARAGEGAGCLEGRGWPPATMRVDWPTALVSLTLARCSVVIKC